MQEAYKSAIRGIKHKDSPPPDSYLVPTREVQPLIRKIMEYHSDEMEMAMEQGSKLDLDKAIAACKKEQLMYFPAMLVKAEKKIQTMTDSGGQATPSLFSPGAPKQLQYVKRTKTGNLASILVDCA